MSRSGPGLETRSEEHTSELQSRSDLVCRLLLEKKNRLLYPPLSGPHPPSRAHRTRPLRPRRVRVGARGVLRGEGGAASRGGIEGLFFFKDRAPAGIYPLSLHAALPI